MKTSLSGNVDQSNCHFSGRCLIDGQIDFKDYCWEYYGNKRINNFWRGIACGNRNKLSYIIYNLCRQRYEEDNQSSSEWFIMLANLLNKYGIDFIPNQEAIVKEVVKKFMLI